MRKKERAKEKKEAGGGAEQMLQGMMGLFKEEIRSIRSELGGSTGGTTEAAILSLINDQVDRAIRQGIQAAHDRGEALSSG